MKFKSLKKILDGNFLTRYDITYEAEDHQIKVYEMVSRNKNIRTMEDLHNHSAEAVVMIMHDETGGKILLNREFRMALGQWVYNFPAGLVDEGETLEQAAVRELKEETGLDLISIDEKLGESWSAVGLSNEKTSVFIGKAAGRIAGSNSPLEEIQAEWYSKEEIRKLLKEPGCNFAARTQAYCYMWSR